MRLGDHGGRITARWISVQSRGGVALPKVLRLSKNSTPMRHFVDFVVLLCLLQVLAIPRWILDDSRFSSFLVHIARLSQALKNASGGSGSPAEQELRICFPDLVPRPKLPKTYLTLLLNIQWLHAIHRLGCPRANWQNGFNLSPTINIT